MKKTSRTLVAFWAATSSLLVLSSANGDMTATTAADPVIELPPLVVTGELWDTLLARTSASVSVLDETTLQNSSALHFGDVLGDIPNLTWTGGTSRPRYFQIRGIGENSQFEGETPDSTVRFLIDDLDFTGLGGVAGLFDVEQVEVLRGPQAGAFGANAAGGMVKLKTADPTPFWTGRAEGTVGTDNLVGGAFAIGGPVLENDPETLQFRIAAQRETSNGFRDNRYLGRDDTNERDETMARLKLRWNSSPDWQWDGTLFYANSDNGYDEFSLDNSGFDTFSDEPGRDEQKSVAGSLRGQWSGDLVTFTTITTWTSSDSLYSYDSDWGAGYTSAFGTIFESGYFGCSETEREREVGSIELRIDSKEQTGGFGLIDRWTVGLYFATLDEETNSLYRDESDTAAVTSDYETGTLAAFMQVAHYFSERARVILGLRYERHEVDFVSNLTDPYVFEPDVPAGISSASENDDLFGGKLTFEQDINDSQMIFTSVTHGYKAGGANGSFRVAGQPLTYEDESLWNYEIGLRSDWLDGRINSQVTVFYLDREDAQLRDADGAGGFFRYFTSNQGDATHYGAEAEATWFFKTDWSVNARLGLLQAELDDGSRDLANAPTYTYGASLSYRPASGLFGTVGLAGSDAYYESNSADNSEQRNAFTVVNASIGYRHDNWTITLWARNLLDEEYEKRVFYFDNFDSGGEKKRYEDPADPRQFGLTARRRF